MIKVLQVISDTNIGGAGTVLLTCLRHFDKSKFDIKVVLPRRSLLIEPINKLGYETIETFGGADKSFDKSAIKEFKRIFKEEKPDIVHTHASLSARIAAKQTGVPVRLYTRHSVFDPTWTEKSFPYKQLSGMFSNPLATKVIAVSEAARINLIQTGIKKSKIVTIYNGAEPLRAVTEEDKARLRAELGIRDGEFVAIMSARLEAVKGHRYFIKAAEIIKETNPNFKFLILGTGSEELMLREYAKDTGVSKNVIFCGFEKDVAPYIAISDLLVNCSFGTEATSMATAEAMSLSKPSVVSDFGGNVFMVEDGKNGFVVPKKNAEALAETLLSLMNDRERLRTLGECAKKTYEEKFTGTRMTEQIEELYLSQYEKYCH